MRERVPPVATEIPSVLDPVRAAINHSMNSENRLTLSTRLCLPAIVLTAATLAPLPVHAAGTTAISDSDFLNSIGTQSAISVRGENLHKTIECAKYLGVRAFRAGLEASVPMQQYVQPPNEAGLRFS